MPHITPETVWSEPVAKLSTTKASHAHDIASKSPPRAKVISIPIHPAGPARVIHRPTSNPALVADFSFQKHHDQLNAQSIHSNLYPQNQYIPTNSSRHLAAHPDLHSKPYTIALSQARYRPLSSEEFLDTHCCELVVYNSEPSLVNKWGSGYRDAEGFIHQPVSVPRHKSIPLSSRRAFSGPPFVPFRKSTDLHTSLASDGKYHDKFATAYRLPPQLSTPIKRQENPLGPQISAPNHPHLAGVTQRSLVSSLHPQTPQLSYTCAPKESCPSGKSYAAVLSERSPAHRYPRQSTLLRNQTLSSCPPTNGLDLDSPFSENTTSITVSTPLTSFLDEETRALSVLPECAQDMPLPHRVHPATLEIIFSTDDVFENMEESHAANNKTPEWSIRLCPLRAAFPPRIREYRRRPIISRPSNSLASLPRACGVTWYPPGLKTSSLPCLNETRVRLMHDAIDGRPAIIITPASPTLSSLPATFLPDLPNFYDEDTLKVPDFNTEIITIYPMHILPISQDAAPDLTLPSSLCSLPDYGKEVCNQLQLPSEFTSANKSQSCAVTIHKSAVDIPTKPRLAQHILHHARLLGEEPSSNLDFSSVSKDVAIKSTLLRSTLTRPQDPDKVEAAEQKKNRPFGARNMSAAKLAREDKRKQKLQQKEDKRVQQRRKEQSIFL